MIWPIRARDEEDLDSFCDEGFEWGEHAQTNGRVNEDKLWKTDRRRGPCDETPIFDLHSVI
jgi:hypothetical protein